SWLHRHRIFPAGDYLHPDYPATLEAAVQSGFASAEACLQSLSDAV
ncbi:TPA: oxidoreductase, partial [Neisseria meningitidis]